MDQNKLDISINDIEQQFKHIKNPIVSLSLSDVLFTLDGIKPREGSIILWDTNFPDKYDKSLTRPGRIDHIIRFDACSSKNIVKYSKCDVLPGSGVNLEYLRAPCAVVRNSLILLRII